MLRLNFRALLTAVVLAAVVTGAFQSAPVHAAKAGVVTLTFTQEPDSLNPMYTTNYFSGLAYSLYLAPAWAYDEKLNLVPRLAKEIPTAANGGVSADGKVITVKLRDDAKWSDGEAITADDFVFTAAMYADKKNSPLGRTPYDSVTVEAKDKTTVVATFKEPYAPWPALLFTGGILPAHILKPIYDKDGTLDKADYNTMPTVASGPFKLKEYQKGQFLIFERNDTYFGAKAKLDQILIKIIADDAAQVAAIKSGDTDFGIFLAGADAADVQKSAPVEVLTVASGYNEGWFFNLNSEGGHPAVRDVKVRQALNKAIDRAELTKALFNDLQKPAVSYWDPTPYQDVSLAVPQYDPEGAKKLLDDAGWKAGTDGIREKDGVKLKLRYATNTRDVRKDAQLIIQGQLKKIGVDVELINYPNQQFLASYEKEGPVARGKFDIAQWSSSTNFPDPNTSRFRSDQIPTAANNFSGANWSHLSDPALDKLFDQQRSTVDAAARTKIFNQISKLMTDNVYWLPLWQDPDIWSVAKRVTGVKLSGVAPFWNANEWEAK